MKPLTTELLQANQDLNASFEGQHILSVNQFSRRQVDGIILCAERTRDLRQEKKLIRPLEGDILANIFYEPSTRTSSSFVAAMEILGGSVIDMREVKQFSSVVKGENLHDTIRTMETYADVLVLRHPETGIAAEAAKFTQKPLINAGDGKGEHPTQALLDIATIDSEQGKTDGLVVTMLGDLKHGRTVHSLARLLSPPGYSDKLCVPRLPENAPRNCFRT